MLTAPERRITGFCLWHCQVSTLDGSVSCCCWLRGVRKAKTRHKSKGIPILFLKRFDYIKESRGLERNAVGIWGFVWENFCFRQTIKHTNLERWLTRSADIEGNGHVSVEWFLDWNELDWSRVFIVTPAQFSGSGLISRIIKVQDTRCLKLAISYTRLIICKVAWNCKHIYTWIFLMRRIYHLFNPKNQCYHRRSEVFSNKGRER